MVQYDSLAHSLLLDLVGCVNKEVHLVTLQCAKDSKKGRAPTKSEDCHAFSPTRFSPGRYENIIRVKRNGTGEESHSENGAEECMGRTHIWQSCPPYLIRTAMHYHTSFLRLACHPRFVLFPLPDCIGFVITVPPKDAYGPHTNTLPLRVKAHCDVWKRLVLPSFHVAVVIQERW